MERKELAKRLSELSLFLQSPNIYPADFDSRKAADRHFRKLISDFANKYKLYPTLANGIMYRAFENILENGEKIKELQSSAKEDLEHLEDLVYSGYYHES